MDAAKKKGVRIGCAPDTFMGAGIQTARKLLDEGTIGKPVAFTAFMMGAGHESWHPSPEFYYEVGGGPEAAALKAQVAESGLEGCVIFTGRVPHAEIQRYYELIDLLAYPRLPSRLTELVTPLKPLEAMAQGRIFVASDVGGHRELIRHGQTGFLCPAGDADALETALEDALARRNEWPALRARARRFVEQERTWANSVARYAEVYERALQAQGQPVPALG